MSKNIKNNKNTIHSIASRLFHPLSFSIIVTLSVIYYLQVHFKEESQKPIEIEREFRAAWVATVDNINWPSKPGLPASLQKKEAIHILDSLRDSNFNAVIFQVRPQADALYKSELEPWSYFLSGEQGTPPSPLYDPLDFWIQEAHKRGLELHAWVNPYRAHHIKGGEISDFSVVKTKPHLVAHLEQGYKWLIPTMEETKQYSYDVVMDIVNRYDVDGIHMDDYFYPYPSYNEGNDFPDSSEYQKYKKNGGNLSLSDWRRDAVNDFIQRVYKGIKASKNYVKFGISPFGIWKSGYPKPIRGMSQYDKLYADAKLWLNEGWIDYFSPQLYWKITQYPQSFPLLLRWWADENYLNRHLWPGIHANLASDQTSILESLNSIMISRALLGNNPGAIFWNVNALSNNEAFKAELIQGPYKNPALIPSSPWLSNVNPLSPSIKLDYFPSTLSIQWRHDHRQDIQSWLLYTRYGDQWSYEILNSNAKQILINLNKMLDDESVEKIPSNNETLTKHLESLNEIILTAVDRYGNESDSNPIMINNQLDNQK